MQERLQKVLATCGCGSRRECERFIADGRVAVNGVVVTELGTRADPERDRITLDGRPVQPPPLRYIALYKPRGVASTRRDPHAKRTVMDRSCSSTPSECRWGRGSQILSGGRGFR